MMRSYYIARVQGIASSYGQIAMCYPSVPPYASADQEYIAGALCEEPSGALSSQWDLLDSSMSTGRFRIVVDTDRLPCNLRAVRPLPASELTVGISSTDTDLEHATSNTVAGISVGDVLYIGTESVLVTTATGASDTMTVERGYGGSQAITHKAGADVFRTPPGLVGRRITVYHVTHDAASSDDETVVAAGQISSEAAWDHHGLVTLQAMTDLTAMQITGVPPIPRENSGDGYTVVYCPIITPTPGNPAGVYLMDKDTGEVYPADTVGAIYFDEPVWSARSQARSDGEKKWTFLICSDTLLRYPAYRYSEDDGSTWIASDNPVVITLCTLLSLDGSNHDAGDERWYDLGDYRDYIYGGAHGGLYPGFSLGVPRELVDLEKFEDLLFGELAGIRAPCLWLGARPESVRDLMRRIWAPLGYAVGTTRAGVWTVVRVGDAYPGADTVSVSAVADASTWDAQVQSRAVSSVIIHTDPDPLGETTDRVVIRETSGSAYYPSHIGQTEEIRSTPYRLGQYDDDTSPMYIALSSRVRRLAGRLCLLSDIGADPAILSQLDVGTRVSISEGSFFDPSTGQRISSAVTGQVTEVSADMYSGAGRYGLVLGSSQRTTLYSPSALVEGWDAGSLTLTVSEHEYTTEDQDADSSWFQSLSSSAYVTLVDSHGVARTATSGVYCAHVQSVTSNTIVVDQMKTSGGASVTPVAGDILVIADYDEAFNYRDYYGHDAAGGSTAVPSLGTSGDDPYRYGD